MWLGAALHSHTQVKGPRPQPLATATFVRRANMGPLQGNAGEAKCRRSERGRETQRVTSVVKREETMINYMIYNMHVHLLFKYPSSLS